MRHLYKSAMKTKIHGLQNDYSSRIQRLSNLLAVHLWDSRYHPKGNFDPDVFIFSLSPMKSLALISYPTLSGRFRYALVHIYSSLHQDKWMVLHDDFPRPPYLDRINESSLIYWKRVWSNLPSVGSFNFQTMILPLLRDWC